MEQEAALVRPRFARGCRCFAVMIDGAVAGYGWLSASPEWIGELQLEIRPRKAEGYIWNCMTLTGYRRRGVFRALVIGIAEAARQTGFTRLWIGSVAVPAEKALAPAGFSPAAHFWILRLAGLYLMKPSFVESTLGREARNVLQVGSGVYGGTAAQRIH